MIVNNIIITVSALPYQFKVTIDKTTAYTPKMFKWSDEVLLGQYEYMNPKDNGYTVKFSKEICSHIGLQSSSLAYSNIGMVKVS